MILELILNEVSYSTEQMILMIAFFVISAIAAISINKFVHALIARRYGDVSAKKIVSKNPLRKISSSNVLSIFVMLLFGFSWVKNSKPQSSRGKNMFIALSGPLANIIACFIGLILYQVFFIIAEIFYKVGQNSILEGVLSLIMAFVSVNTAFAIFNLIPVPPLDGGNFIAQFLPEEIKETYLSFEKYSLFVLVFLIIFLARSGISNILIGGLINGLQAIILPIFSLI